MTLDTQGNDDIGCHFEITSVSWPFVPMIVSRR